MDMEERGLNFTFTGRSSKHMLGYLEHVEKLR